MSGVTIQFEDLPEDVREKIATISAKNKIVISTFRHPDGFIGDPKIIGETHALEIHQLCEQLMGEDNE